MTRPTRDPKTGRFVAQPKVTSRPPETYIRRDQLPPLNSDLAAQLAAGHSYIDERYGDTPAGLYAAPPKLPSRRSWPRVAAALLLLVLASAITVALIIWARR